MGLVEITTDPRGDPNLFAPLEKIAVSSSKEITQQEPVVESEVQSVFGAGKKRLNEYAKLGKEIMETHNMKQLEASTYMKEHKLYTLPSKI